jgi:hypothetical protein
MLIDPKAPQQRTGVLGSLNMSADSFRLLPKEDETASVWTATKWAETRRGWIFITSRPTMREALRPLISLWIDTLVLRLLNEPMPDQKPVWFVIDELASLQRLPQLHTAITENRKSQNPVILGFQGRSQMEARYGEDAEAMLSQPATKIFLRTTEPRAAKWVSEAIGEIEIERLRETHYDGSTRGTQLRARPPDGTACPAVRDLGSRRLARLSSNMATMSRAFRFPFIELEEKSPGLRRAEMDDLIVPTTPLPSNRKQFRAISCFRNMRSNLRARNGVDAHADNLKPLSAGQAQSYHQKEFIAKEQNYWSQRGEIAGEWQGRLATHFGLAGAVSAEDFARLSQGQHPQTGEQLVRQRASYEYRMRTARP